MLGDQNILGMACADGALHLCALRRSDANAKFVHTTKTSPCVNRNPNVDGEGSSSMCLSLDWNSKKVPSSSPHIGVSHSSGTLTVWEYNSSGLHLLHEWQAHDYEAWIVAFNDWQPDILWSGMLQ